MAVFTKQFLSSSQNGRTIQINTVNQGTVLHSATSGTLAIDEVWLYAWTTFGSGANLTVSWGGTTVADSFVVGVPASSSGRIQIVDGRLINNGLNVIANTVQAGTGGVFIDGFVNRIQ